jgi:hypothetical protein
MTATAIVYRRAPLDVSQVKTAALVLPVHAGGLLGHGVTYLAKLRWPELAAPYARACAVPVQGNGQPVVLGKPTLQPGGLLPLTLGRTKAPYAPVFLLACLATAPGSLKARTLKRGGAAGSNLPERASEPPHDRASEATLTLSLTKVVAEIRTRKLTSVTLPPLASGPREPGWTKARAIIEGLFAPLAADGVAVEVFEPCWTVVAAPTPEQVAAALAAAPAILAKAGTR